MYHIFRSNPPYQSNENTDILAFLILDNPASTNVQTPNYYSQVYIPFVIDTWGVNFH